MTPHRRHSPGRWQGKRNKPFVREYLSYSVNRHSTERLQDIRLKAMAQRLCAWRSRETYAANDVTAAQRWRHQRWADVTRGGGARGTKARRKTHTGTHCGMHAQFFDKKGTNGQACTTHLTHTHASSSSSLLLLRRTGRCSPRVTLHTLPPLDTHCCASFPFRRPRRRHACLCIFVCVMRVKCMYRFRVWRSKRWSSFSVSNFETCLCAWSFVPSSRPADSQMSELPSYYPALRHTPVEFLY